VRRFEVPAGTVRVRVSHSGLDTLSEDGLRGKDRYRVAVWPGDAIAPRVVKRWKEPEKARAVPEDIQPPKTRKQAVAAALAGRCDLALPKLLELSRTKADALAAVSAAEILAYQGDWRGVIEHAAVFVKDLTVVGGSNLFDDILELLRRAGRETGDWPAVVAAAKGVPERAVPHFHTVAKVFVRDIGKGIHQKPPESDPGRGQPDRSAYDQWEREGPTSKRFKGQPEALARHLFALAVGYGLDDEALALFSAHRDTLGFDKAAHVARILVKRGRPEEAWEVLDGKMGKWHAGWVMSVAPVELLIDPVLAQLMTPARCAKVLATPRGVG